MKSLWQSLLATAVFCTLHVRAFKFGGHVTINSGNCVHTGKCDKNYDCCSGLCDPVNGCVTEAEVRTLFAASYDPNTLFIPRTDAFDGARYDGGVIFDYDPSTTTAEDTCASGSICVVGNAATQGQSSRFWFGKCSPLTLECVTYAMFGLENRKKLSRVPCPDPDETLGLCCASDSDCTVGDICILSAGDCLVDVQEAICPPLVNLGTQLTVDDAERDREFCALTVGSVANGDTCMCSQECMTNYQCVLPALQYTPTPSGYPKDLSVAGTCLAVPLADLGAGACAASPAPVCMPGHECQTLEGGGTGCALPAGATGCTGDNDCAGSTDPTRLTVCDSGTCVIPQDGACEASKQCQDGLVCNDAGICRPLNILFDPCGASGATGPFSTNCAAAYAATGFSSRLRVSDSGPYMGAQHLSLPVTGFFKITAVGAAGGTDTDLVPQTTMGFGAEAFACYSLSENDELIIVAGQQGESVENCGAGGGASMALLPGPSGFLDDSSEEVLLVAGAGGGEGDQTSANGGDGCNASTVSTGLGTLGQEMTCTSKGGGTVKTDGVDSSTSAATGGKGYTSLTASFFGKTGVANGGFGGGGSCDDTQVAGDDFGNGGGAAGYSGGDAGDVIAAGMGGQGAGGGGSFGGGGAIVGGSTLSYPPSTGTQLDGTVRVEYCGAACC